MDPADAGLSVRSMRLKVLYTFDKEHKNNHLARGQNILQIQTAYVDETTQIGIIDLKTCVQTIVTASPELVAKLEEDFTIYAYDYSEPDSPLVGQGMLSWALASPHAASDDQDGETNNMITGRVTRSVLGLFSKNAQETLEVKLRLVPVPSSTQADYLNSLQKYQEMSEAVGHGFDAQSWTNFIQSNPGIVSRSGQTPPMENMVSPVNRTGLETMQRMLTEGASPRDTSDISSLDSMQQLPRGPGSRPTSRSGTPVMTQNFQPPLRRTGSQVSRPSSRTSVRDVALQPQLQASNHQRRESFNSGYYSAEENFDEGPAKKRAKILQSDWSSKPNLNIERQPDSLRVAASTAASVRLHRPVPLNPVLQVQQSNNEEPVRPPTPIARMPRAQIQRARTTSALRTGSSAQESASLSGSSIPAYPEMASPEDTRAPSSASTPANLPSSPPIMQLRTSLPSSPMLPPMNKEHDSGFMSGDFDIDSYFTDHPLLNFHEDFPDSNLQGQGFEFVQDSAMPNSFPAHPSVQPSAESSQSPPAPVASVPQPGSYVTQQKKIKPRAQSSRPASRLGMHSPKLAAAPYPRARQIEQERNEQGEQALPQIAASDPMGPALHRSQTWAGELTSDIPMSDMPEPTNPTNGRRSRPKRFGKEQTANRLNAAISGGEMPPFCDNCGSIETPAWRKAWAKVFDSGWNEFETGLEKDSFLAKEAMDQDEEGNVTKFKAFKLSKSPGDNDQEFMSVNLCNPCGLWLHKQKCMRPESRWNKNPKDPKEKKKRPSRPRSQRRAAQKKRDEDSTRSDAPDSSPEGSDGSPGGEMDGEENDAEDGGQPIGEDDGEPELPPMPTNYRATSAEPSSKTNFSGTREVDAIVRRVQSSPLRHDIADDLSQGPKSLRRVLFSPDQSKAKALSAASGNVVRRSPRLNKTVDMFSGTKTPTAGKENVATNAIIDDGLDDLFDNGDDDDLPHPQTPTPTRRTDRILFKTPEVGPTPSRVLHRSPMMLSPAAQKLIQSLKTPKNLLNSHSIATAMLGDRPAGEEMTPFTFQMHQILSDAAELGSPLGSSKKNKRARNPVTDSRGSRKSNNGNVDSIFDFPDLPPLNNAGSPSSTAGAAGTSAAISSDALPHMVDFSEFTNADLHGATMEDLMMIDEAELQELLSTDVVMPSSPPPLTTTRSITTTTTGSLHNSTSNGTSGTGFFDPWLNQNHTHGGEDAAVGTLWNEFTEGGGHHVSESFEGTDGSFRRVSPRKNKGQHRKF